MHLPENHVRLTEEELELAIAANRREWRRKQAARRYEAQKAMSKRAYWLQIETF